MLVEEYVALVADEYSVLHLDAIAEAVVYSSAPIGGNLLIDTADLHVFDAALVIDDAERVLVHTDDMAEHTEVVVIDQVADLERERTSLLGNLALACHDLIGVSLVAHA